VDDRTLARFMSKVVVQPNGCWYFNNVPCANGYHLFSVGGKRYYVHRLSYVHFKGPIADDHDVDHECHNQDASCPGGVTCLHRGCVNPVCLIDRTHELNCQLGRRSGPRVTHCLYDHEYAGSNLYIDTDGSRKCLECKRRISRESARRRRAIKRAGKQGVGHAVRPTNSLM
jgi:hypothetical protein